MPVAKSQRSLFSRVCRTLIIVGAAFSEDLAIANETNVTPLPGLMPSSQVVDEKEGDSALFGNSQFCDATDFENCSNCERLDQFSLFAAIDGAKQPQDYGVNADLGVQVRAQYSAALLEEFGIGYQVGSSAIWTDNAVRVFELLGEDTNRFQTFTTAGLFQRVGRWGWGGVFDYLYQDGFDRSSLGQFRGRLAYDVTKNTQVGLTGHLRAFDDTAVFLGDQVTLRSINQGSFFFRHFFETGVQSTWWFGLADEHGESNAAFGPAPARDTAFIIGADFVAPLNESLALYGETNLIAPADTGTVDAFFGVAWYPFTNAKTAHRARYSPLLPTAAPTSFSVDLLP